MTIVKGAAALIATAFIIVGAAVPAQAQYLSSGASATDPSTGFTGWQASSVNSPNRDFMSVGAPSGGNYANTFGFATGAGGADANASCYPAHVRHRLANGHMVTRNETVCP
ncbi:MAG TPA: hypothetical protein VGJ01_23555 [Pseudolabrys sp.]|jgi:hypothetical protein